MSDPGFPPPAPEYPPPPPVPPGDGGGGALPPGDGEPPRPGNPWEQRDRLGVAEAFVSAVKMFITRPGEAFALTRESGDLASPLLFGLVLGWIGVVAGQMWNLALRAPLMAWLPGEFRAQVAPFLAFNLAAFAAQLLLSPLLVIIYLFVWSAILHLCLMLVGGTSRSRSGFEGTFRAVSYAGVAQLGQLVPLIGGLIALVWGIVLEVIGLVRLHRTGEGRALAAVLLPLLLCCLCCGLLAILFGAAIMAAIGGVKH